jgi:hypothetical protein
MGIIASYTANEIVTTALDRTGSMQNDLQQA